MVFYNSWHVTLWVPELSSKTLAQYGCLLLFVVLFAVAHEGIYRVRQIASSNRSNRCDLKAHGRFLATCKQKSFRLLAPLLPNTGHAIAVVRQSQNHGAFRCLRFSAGSGRVPRQQAQALHCCKPVVPDPGKTALGVPQTWERGDMILLFQPCMA